MKGGFLNEIFKISPNEEQISSRNDQFLLLDPYTHQTVEAVSPSNWKGETIQALRFGNETFFLWN